VPRWPVLFKASRSCSPIHLKYAFRKEKASNPNILCSNWVIILGADLGSPHIDLCSRIMILSSLLSVGSEKATE
jgi:hypothetical protein